ncbi:MAG: magnesium transporter CorA family protein [Chloroflexota bacterium]
MSDTLRRRHPLSLIRGGRRFRRPNRRATHVQPDEPAIRSIEYDGKRWIDIRRPDSDVLDEIGAEFNLHPLLLEDITSRIQRPKIDVYDDYLFIVMQFPIHDKESRENASAEIDFVVGRDFFMTVHDGSLRPLTTMVDSVFDSDEMSIKLLERTPGHLLYEVVDRLVDYVVPIAPRLELRVERIEEMIFQAQAMETVQEISLVRRDLISLRRILKPQLPILNRFELGNLPFLEDEIDDYWGDVADHLGRTNDSIEELAEILAALSDTHDTLISQRMNDIIKTLTIFSVLLLPLTLVSGFFGMNVPLPGQDEPLTTIVVITFMLCVSLAMLVYFRKRRWL